MASRKDNKGRVLRTGESQRKDGTYQFRYTDAFGKRQCVYAKTLDQLRQKEEDVLKNQIDGIDSSGQKMTFDNLFALFLRLKENQVRETTYETYSCSRKLVAKYPISRLQIGDIHTSLMKEWLYSLLKDGYSQGTIRSLKHTLHGVFDIAVSDDLIRKNPCSFKLYFKEKVPTQKFALTLIQQKQLLEYIKEHKRFVSYYNMVVILMGTGMRISELLGLTIKDIDFSNRRISVNHQLIRNSGSQFIVTPPKSEKGNRLIPMLKDVEASLKNQIANRNPKQEAIIDGYYGFLFVNQESGLPYTRAAIRYALTEIIEAYNCKNSEKLPHLSPHIFRHTFASTMIQSGMDAKTLQHILGHANVSTTLDIYTHMFDEHADFAIKQAEEFISASR